jgi:hypothetical protein
MTTKLTTPLKREVQIDGQAYVITLSAAGVLVTKKRARSGTALSLKQLAGIDPITAPRAE